MSWKGDHDNLLEGILFGGEKGFNQVFRSFVDFIDNWNAVEKLIAVLEKGMYEKPAGDDAEAQSEEEESC